MIAETQKIQEIQDILCPNTLLFPDNLSKDNGYLEYYNIQVLPIRYLNIKIEILNENNTIIGEVSGTAIDGSYNINADAQIRRTCNLSFYLDEGHLPNNNDSLFWINKKFHLLIGLKSIDGTKIYWFNKGTYAINDPEVNISVNDKTISISGLDKMALHTGDITGQLPYSIKATVENGDTIERVVRGVMEEARETEDNIFIIDNVGRLKTIIPYDIESSIGDNVTDVLDKLIELLANYQYYYDLDGHFIFAPKPINSNFKTFPIEWDFSQDNSLVISVDRSLSYSNVKNRITVWGGVHDDGYQPSYTLELHNSDEDFGSSPFTYERLKEGFYRDYVEQNDDYIDAVLDFDTSDTEIYYPYNVCVKYNKGYYRCNNKNGIKNTDGEPQMYDDPNWLHICEETWLDTEDTDRFNQYMEGIHAYSIQSCEERARELMFDYNLASETITITCVPIYSLDVNSVIKLNDEKSGAIGSYVVQEISCNLGTNGTMTIKANKLFE